jgi:hypothetical protein
MPPLGGEVTSEFRWSYMSNFPPKLYCTTIFESSLANFTPQSLVYPRVFGRCLDVSLLHQLLGAPDSRCGRQRLPANSPHRRTLVSPSQRSRIQMREALQAAFLQSLSLLSPN